MNQEIPLSEFRVNRSQKNFGSISGLNDFSVFDNVDSLHFLTRLLDI